MNFKSILRRSFCVVATLRLAGCTFASVASEPSIHPGAIDFGFNAGFPLAPNVVGWRSMVTGPDNSLVLVLENYSQNNNRSSPHFVMLDPQGRSQKQFSVHLTNNMVRGAAFDAQGRLLVIVSDQPTPRLFRFTSDGGLDAIFTFDAYDMPEVVCPLADESIFIGGRLAAGMLVRMPKFGEVDRTFTVSGGGYLVTQIAVQKDGKIIISGSFPEVNSVPRNRIARLNPDGSLDTDYNPGTKIAATSTLEINSLLLDSTDRLYLAGNFSVVEGKIRTGFARLLPSGQLDLRLNFQPQYGISSLSITPAGDVIAAGNPTVRIKDESVQSLWWNAISVQERTDGNTYVLSWYGEWNSFLALYSRDGSRVTDFNPPGPTGTVRRVKLLPSGQVVIAGDFYSTIGFPHTGLAILKPDGSVDTNFVCSVPGILDFDIGTSGRIFYTTRGIPPRIGYYDYPSGFQKELSFPNDTFFPSVLALRDGKVLVSGDFDPTPGAGDRIVRFESNLEIDSSWNTNLTAGATTMVESPDRAIYAAGGFTVVKFSSEGLLDRNFKAPVFSDTSPNGSLGILNLKLDTEERLLVCGGFNRVNRTNVATGIVRLRSDGAIDEIPQLPPGIPFYSPVTSVRDILPRPGGSLLVAVGNEITSLGDPNWHVSIASPGNGGSSGIIHVLATVPDGGIYAGGDFSIFNGMPSPKIVRLWADNIPLKIRIEKLRDTFALTLNGQPGSTIQLETSVDLKSWSLDQRFDQFSGLYTNLLQTDDTSWKFIRARRIN